MNQIISFLDSIVAKVGLEEVNNVKVLQGPCSKIGIKPAHAAVVGGTIALLSIVLGVAARFLSTFICMIYPTYRSIQAIETQGQNDDKQWLTYWILYAIITLADSTIGFALEFIPFYHVLKLALFVALFHPQWKGAETIYDKFIKPQYDKYHSQIDKKLEDLTNKATDKFQDLKNKY